MCPNSFILLNFTFTFDNLIANYKSRLCGQGLEIQVYYYPNRSTHVDVHSPPLLRYDVF